MLQKGVILSRLYFIFLLLYMELLGGKWIKKGSDFEQTFFHGIDWKMAWDMHVRRV